MTPPLPSKRNDFPHQGLPTHFWLCRDYDGTSTRNAIQSSCMSGLRKANVDSAWCYGTAGEFYRSSKPSRVSVSSENKREPSFSSKARAAGVSQWNRNTASGSTLLSNSAITTFPSAANSQSEWWNCRTQHPHSLTTLPIVGPGNASGGHSVAIQRSAPTTAISARPISTQIAKLCIRFMSHQSGVGPRRIEAGGSTIPPGVRRPRQFSGRPEGRASTVGAFGRSRSRPTREIGISQAVGTGCASIQSSRGGDALIGGKPLRLALMSAASGTPPSIEWPERATSQSGPRETHSANRPTDTRYLIGGLSRASSVTSGQGWLPCSIRYLTNRERQFRRWQTLAVSGKILPSPCGSRRCAESFGARMLRRNWSSAPAAVTGRVALGHQVTARRRSTSFSCFSAIPNAGKASSNTSWTVAMRNGGKTSSRSGKCAPVSR
jgi:hypothetical protein